MSDVHFAAVVPGDGSNGASDIKLAQVPQVAALLGIAVLDASRAGNLELRIESDGAIDVQGLILTARPGLLALLRNLGAS